MPKKSVMCVVQDCTMTNTEKCDTCHHNVNSAFHVDCEVESKCVKLDTNYCRQSCHHNRNKQPLKGGECHVVS